MIGAKSASYPVLGAARAAKVEYGLALRLVWERRQGGDPLAYARLYREGAQRHGAMAMLDLCELLFIAWAGRRLVINVGYVE